MVKAKRTNPYFRSMAISGSLERMVSGRWIAGPEMSDAIRETKIFNRDNISTVINRLGEDYKDWKDVDKAMAAYTSLVKIINKEKLKSSISVKATELGMLMDYRSAQRNYSELLKIARKCDVFVWLDMEESGTVSNTLKLYETEVKKGSVGICIQAYLKRSGSDIKQLLGYKNANIRLVKGAYSTTNKESYSNRKECTENYSRLMTLLFKEGRTFTIATHDGRLIESALKMNERYKRDVTYAMLKGIRNQYALRLAKIGEKVALYVPFGKEWTAYSYRRMKEAGHITLIMRSLLENQQI
jgi:proline dehydrogenase